jgi:glycosyltransferase involved in cell wall biosynthesis
MSRVLLIGLPQSRFVRQDLAHLKEAFQVDFYQPRLFLKPKKEHSPLLFLTLFKKILRSDVIVCWFANIDSFFACLFAKLALKRFIVIVGGVDAAYQPEIGYGLFVKRTTRIQAFLIYRLADVIAPVNVSLLLNLSRYLPFDITDRSVVLPTGYDPHVWTAGSVPKEPLVLTVGAVNKKNYDRKGFKTFIEMARQMPTVRFALVGKWGDSLADHLREQGLPPNLELTGFVSDAELLQYYQRAKVYCQLSKFEGLPNALCEAMLCECFPIGTRACGIPSAIGKTGAYVRYGCVSDCVRAVRFALSLGKCSSARHRIIAEFPQGRRKEGLIRIISGHKLLHEVVEFGVINRKESRVEYEMAH